MAPPTRSPWHSSIWSPEAVVSAVPSLRTGRTPPLWYFCPNTSQFCAILLFDFETRPEKKKKKKFPKFIFMKIFFLNLHANKNLTIIIEATLEKNKDAWKGVKVTSSGRSGYILAKVSKSQRQASAAHIFRPTCPFNDHCLLIGTPGARRAISFMRAVPR